MRHHVDHRGVVGAGIDRADQLDDHLARPEERLRLAVAEVADAPDLEPELARTPAIVRSGSSVNTTRWSSSERAVRVRRRLDGRGTSPSVQPAIPVSPTPVCIARDRAATHRRRRPRSRPPATRRRRPTTSRPISAGALIGGRSHSTSSARRSSLGSTLSRESARQAEHDLFDPDRRVVLELARVGNGAERNDAQRLRIAAARLARPLEVGERGPHAGATDRDPAVGVLRHVPRTASVRPRRR